MIKQPDRDKTKHEPSIGPEPIVLMKNEQHENKEAEQAGHLNSESGGRNAEGYRRASF